MPFFSYCNLPETVRLYPVWRCPDVAHYKPRVMIPFCVSRLLETTCVSSKIKLFGNSVAKLAVDRAGIDHLEAK